MRGAWEQFHGSASNSGWKLRATADQPTRPEWQLEFGPDVGYVGTSPVVDSEGVIYLGTANGHLIAVNPDGTERWRRNYGNPIVAAPAVAEDGSIYFITQKEIRTDTDDGDHAYRSLLTKANSQGGFLWSVELADDGFTLSAPKLWNRPGGEHVLVYFTRQSSLKGELCVVDSNGQIRVRVDGLGCPWPVTSRWDVIGLLKDIRDVLFPPFDTSGIDIGLLLPSELDPTLAITDASNLVDDGTALVAIADNACNLAVYRYDGSRLEQLWFELQDLEPRQSSPLISAFGHLIVGNEEGKVTAFDVLTGREDWTYDAEEPVLSTPASFGMITVVVSRRHVHRVHTANGHQIDKMAFVSDRRALSTLGSSPVVSSNWIHVAHHDGLVSLKLGDPSIRAHDPDYRLGPLAPSPAIGPEGELYVVRGRQLWAYLRS